MQAESPLFTPYDDGKVILLIKLSKIFEKLQLRTQDYKPDLPSPSSMAPVSYQSNSIDNQ